MLSPSGGELLVFGGDEATVVCGGLPAREHVGDTWLLDTACGGWTELTIDGPEARSRHAMALDPQSGRALLFGGRNRTATSGNYTLFQDVWAFDFAGRAWSRLETTGPAPSARHNAGAAVVGGRLWVFGGSDSPSSTAFAPTNDLHSLDLGSLAWTEVSVQGAVPPERLFHAMVGDEKSGKLFVYGGGDANAFTGPFLTDTWVFDVAATSWTELGASVGAVTDPGRIKLGLAAKPGEGDPTLYFFGGHDDGTLGNRNDTLALDPGAAAYRSVASGDVFEMGGAQCNFPPNFTTIDESSPERRSAFAFAPSASGQSFVVFGGDSDCGRLSDAWWFDAVTETWTVIRASLPGLVCPRTGNTACTSLCG